MIFSAPLKKDCLYSYYKLLVKMLAPFPPVHNVSFLPVQADTFEPQNTLDCSKYNIGVYLPSKALPSAPDISGSYQWDMIVVPTDALDNALAKWGLMSKIAVLPPLDDNYSELSAQVSPDDFYSQIVTNFVNPYDDKLSDVYVLNKRGAALAALELFEEASSNYMKSLELEPLNPQTYNCIGNLMDMQKRHKEALLYFDKAIALDKRFVAAHFNKATALKNMENYEDAINFYENALQIDPSFAAGWLNLAVAFGLNKQEDKAEYCFQKTLEFEPLNTDAMFLWGNQLLGQKNYEKAIELHEKVIAIEPDHYLACNSLGIDWLSIMEPEKAYDILLRAIAIKHDMSSAMTNLGTACRDLEKLEESLHWYNRALDIEPDDPDTHWNLSLTLLHLGNYEDGWREYEWRFKKTDKIAIRPCNLPLWDGSDLDGKTLLVQAEQGFGDSIQFMRYLPLLYSLHGKVIWECQDNGIAALATMLSTPIQTITCFDTQPAADLRIPLLSLPLIFRTTISDVPFSSGYLKPSSANISRWSAILNDNLIEGMKIGFVWDGRKTFRNDKRSIPLHKLISIFELKGITFISLQKGEKSIDLEPLKGKYNIIDITEKLETFADTAALIANLDLVVCVDTSVAHLAGAVGCPTYIMLKKGPDWRWLDKRSDSPWYASIKLFRQQKDGDWDNVIANICQELKIKLKLK